MGMPYNKGKVYLTEGLRMKISTKSSIAMHCLIFIAEYGERTRVTSGLLAKSTGCNPAAIRSILGALQKAGLIVVARGVGGAHLAVDPAQLTLWDVYRALEPDGLDHLIGLHPAPSPYCPVGRNIAAVLQEPYRQVGQAVQRQMQQITLAQMLEQYHGLVLQEESKETN